MRWSVVVLGMIVGLAGCVETERSDVGTEATGEMDGREPASGEVSLPDDDVRAILELDRAFQDAVGAGDWASLREIYASDAVHMAPGQDAIEGADQIIAFMRGLGEGGMPGFHTATDVINGDDTIGYHRGTWTAEGGMRGSFLWVLRRGQDGGWRIVADTFTRS